MEMQSLRDLFQHGETNCVWHVALKISATDTGHRAIIHVQFGGNRTPFVSLSRSLRGATKLKVLGNAYFFLISREIENIIVR